MELLAAIIIGFFIGLVISASHDEVQFVKTDDEGNQTVTIKGRVYDLVERKKL